MRGKTFFNSFDVFYTHCHSHYQSFKSSVVFLLPFPSPPLPSKKKRKQKKKEKMEIEVFSCLTKMLRYKMFDFTTYDSMGFLSADMK